MSLIKKNYVLICMCVGLFAFTGCTTIDKRWVREEEKSLGYTKVYDGIELNKVYLKVSNYDAVNEPRISIHTEFIEYERRIDEMEAWKVEVEEGWRYHSTIEENFDNMGTFGGLLFSPLSLGIDCLCYPFFRLGLGYQTYHLHRGPKYDIEQYTKTGDREKKYSGSKLPEPVIFKLVDPDFTIRMGYVDGQLELGGRNKKRLLELDSLRVKFPFEDDTRTLSLTEFHRAHQGHLNLKEQKRSENEVRQKALLAKREKENLAAAAEVQRQKNVTKYLNTVEFQLKNASSSKRMELLEQKAALLIDGRYPEGDRRLKDDRAVAAECYGEMAEIAAETGDFEKMNGYLEKQLKLMNP